jgi:DNA-binding CsgD family transcriptional regulator
MNVKAIPAQGQAVPPRDTPAASQVAMVVMLVPIPTPPAGTPALAEPAAPPTYVDPQDHVWLVVDKASPMAAVFQQITAAESPIVPANNQLLSLHDNGAWQEPSPGGSALADLAALTAEPLSRREIDVLRLIADGRSNKEIAQALILALSTIKMHIKHIYGKLGVKNRVQAVAQARALGLLTTAMH